MPGPAPNEHRRRRNAPTVEWIDLPAEGRTARVPALPDHVTLAKRGRAWWKRAWKHPAATQWHLDDRSVVARRAELEDIWGETKDLRLLAEMRQAETLLGLNAKGRKEMRWRIVDAGGEVVEQATREDEVAKRREKRRKRHAS